VTVQ